MRWSYLEGHQPRLAELGRRRLFEPGVLLVATMRKDGTPRVSPVEPFVMEGQLLLSMLWQSLKAKDLLRDPRILVHSIVTSRDGGAGEFKVRGTARATEDPLVQQRYASAVAQEPVWNPDPGRLHLFSIDVETVTFVRYDDATGDQHLASWPPPREFVRRGTSPTSVGPPDPGQI